MHGPRGEQPRPTDLRMPQNWQKWFDFFQA